MYLFIFGKRERAHERERGREREGERENPKLPERVVVSTASMQLDVGLDPRNPEIIT